MSNRQAIAQETVQRILSADVPQVDAAAAAILAAAPKPTLAMSKLLAAWYIRQGDYISAQAHASALLEADPSAENAMNSAWLLRKAGLTQKALAFLHSYEQLLTPIQRETLACMLYWDTQEVGKACQHGTEVLRLKDSNCDPAPPLKPVRRRLDLDQRSQNVISFSLWGNEPRYVLGAQHNTIVARYLYPGWICRFYVDSSLPSEARRVLIDRGAQVFDAPADLPAERFGLFWRFLVEDDDSVTHWLCRDADAVMNIKERALVESWLTSGCAFHVIRSLPIHCELILAGMWGAHRGNIGRMRARIESHVAEQPKRLNHFASDQEFLRNKIWPIVRQDALVHDQYLSFGDPVRFGNEFALPKQIHIGQNDWIHYRAAKSR